MTTEEKQTLLFKCSKVYSPATPISTRDLFSGRTEQIRLVGQAVHNRGQHAIVFGERGVGKTSLANILRVMLADEQTIVVKVNCHHDDTFVKLWKSALAEIDLVEQHEVAGFKPHANESVESAADLLSDKAGPEEVKRILQQIGKQGDIVVIFDEFDRLIGGKTQRLLADTIKNFSDNAINTTLVVVGVANDVSGLIKEHASVDRSMVQIHMPRMNPDELAEIVKKAMKELDMTIEATAIELLVMLSQGLPHYTHLLGNETTVVAINGSHRKITVEDVKRGVKEALGKTQHSIIEAYQNATRGQRKGTLFQQALLACALAEVDEQGYFVSAAVREPFSKIMKKSYEIPGFSQHLDKFSADESRGPVLEKAGTSRRFRFRFKNPLLQPYVMMRGLADDMIQGNLLELLRAKQKSNKSL